MKIYSMTATFGKLDGAVLELTDGLNVIAAPNEWGKSTWCAFLTAMLYGIDTRERSGKGQLADKEHYEPWSGKPMSGQMRLDWNGRDITIQRRSKGRTPMGDFAAYETCTGLPVEELRGDNCGQMILGVERSVFQRTGFIRFSDLPVRQDEALRSRLNALVTTGDESGTGELLARKLREYKNQCRYRTGGLIPQVTRQIEDLERQLEEQSRLTAQEKSLSQQLEEAKSYHQALDNHRLALDRQQSDDAFRQLKEVSELAKASQKELDDLELQCRNFPSRGELLGRLHQAASLRRQMEETPRRPGKSVLPQTAAWLLTAVLLAAAVVLLFRKSLTAAAVLFGISVICSVAAGILTDIRRKFELNRRIEAHQLDDRREELSQQIEQWNRQLGLVEQLEHLRRETIDTKLRLQALIAQARKTEAPTQEDDLEFSAEQTREELEKIRTFEQQTQLRLGQVQGRMETLPDSVVLLSRLTGAKQRLGDLLQTERALDYGQKALEAAVLELQRRFAPGITRRAGDFLARLTDGQYDRITIGEDLSLQAARKGETTLRPAMWRSDGTVDQMYLALRLAVWEALNPRAPLILDEVLIRFDARRRELAMNLFRELSGARQILLFTQA